MVYYKEQRKTMFLTNNWTNMQARPDFAIESTKVCQATFCTKLYVIIRGKITEEIESHLVPKLKLQVRMWSRILSLVTVATTILRFLPTI